eukprot:TRINITY_DN32538_c0_g1_i1.p1 TRINITY_DN32538_c0_g1~~TRINITY_DN32538_c0_g1_i1.p1  ORF type:complete len:760 (+),score=266.27 TRINITY_DN32538_c0_g1_i1:76-2280(+)
MDGVFESDKAKLKPPPKFLNSSRFGPSSSDAAPVGAMRTAPINRTLGGKTQLARSAPHAHPGESYASHQSAASSPVDRQYVSMPVAGGRRATPPDMIGYEEASNGWSPAPRVHSDPRAAEDISVMRKRAVPVGKKHAKQPSPQRAPGAVKASIRAKSPNAMAQRRGKSANPDPVMRAKSATKKKLPSELEVAKGRVHELEGMVDQQRGEIAQLHDAMEVQYQEAERELEARDAEHQDALAQAGAEYAQLRQQKAEEIAALRAELEEARREIEREKQHVIEEKAAGKKQQEHMQRRVDSIAEEANTRIGEYEDVIEKFQDEVTRLEGVVEARDHRIAAIEHDRDARYHAYEETLMVGEKSRAELHNSLIEMKGNIRVFARVRPLLKREVDMKMGDATTHFDFPEGTDHRQLRVVHVPTHTSVMTGQSEGSKTLPFNFDKVFSPEATQEAVFDEISQLVQSSLDGYKVTIFAYGQTGSGKTYTMEGPDPTTEDHRTGMIARAVNQIFDNTQWKSRMTGFSFQLVCSFLEIYNETLADLLNPTDYGSHKLKHDIRIVDGEATVSNIHEEVVESREHVYHLLRIANENRRTAATKMNDRASRSHSVFQMKIRGYNEATRQSITGLLNLVDLAGSERLSKSQAEGDRLRETQHINKSLACLGDVIAALAKGDGSHIPFRQSKLTHLLQPSMTNASKTLMFVNINPVTDHLHESLCSLRFASKVNSCEIGLARRKVKNKD